MSIIDYPDERERLHQAIIESQRVLDECPECHTPSLCRTCGKHRRQLAEYRAACEALDHDEDQQPAEEPRRAMFYFGEPVQSMPRRVEVDDADDAVSVTDDPMALVTRKDWPETPAEPEYVEVPAGAYKHPGDQVWVWLPYSSAMGWAQAPMKDWGDRVPKGTTTRRLRALDVHVQTIIDKAERLAKRMADPVQRERLLYTITQQKAALARNLKLVMEEIQNASRS